MLTLDRMYVNGEYIEPQGKEIQQLINPATQEVIGQVVLGNEDDARLAIAAGCTVVIKPSELSALQTERITEAFHHAGLQKGVINVVNGYGHTVGAEFTRNPDVALISFTGSTCVGKEILKGAAETLKRVTLELGGKSPNIILDDVDYTKVIPVAVAQGFMNNGQACVAGTRLLVPEHRLQEVK